MQESCSYPHLHNPSLTAEELQTVKMHIFGQLDVVVPDCSTSGIAYIYRVPIVSRHSCHEFAFWEHIRLHQSCAVKIKNTLELVPLHLV